MHVRIRGVLSVCAALFAAASHWRLSLIVTSDCRGLLWSLLSRLSAREDWSETDRQTCDDRKRGLSLQINCTFQNVRVCPVLNELNVFCVSDCPPDIRVSVRGHLCYASSRDDKNVNSLKYLQHRVSGSVSSGTCDQSLVQWGNSLNNGDRHSARPPPCMNKIMMFVFYDWTHRTRSYVVHTCAVKHLFCLITFVYPSFYILWKCCMFCQNYLIKQQMMRVPLSLAWIMSCCMRENVNLMLFTIWCKAIQFKLVSQGPCALGLGFHNSSADFLTT